MTREIHESPLYRVAEDIVDRVGIEQGVIAPGPEDRLELTDEIMGTAEAAERLGISRSAVVKAAQAGRLKGKKIGNTWALLTRSVGSYQVAQHRVEAGRAAHPR
ncbi:MAG: helix-turn-helix domain-containing protein [Acidobacteriota bacterium]